MAKIVNCSSRHKTFSYSSITISKPYLMSVIENNIEFISCLFNVLDFTSKYFIATSNYFTAASLLLAWVPWCCSKPVKQRLLVKHPSASRIENDCRDYIKRREIGKEKLFCLLLILFPVSDKSDLPSSPFVKARFYQSARGFRRVIFSLLHHRESITMNRICNIHFH